LSLCRQLRRLPCHQPLVLMLTARDARRDKVRGFEEGADDYVVEPFDPDLLRVRVRALLRRAHRPLQQALAFTFVGLLAGTLLGHALVTGLAVGAGQWIGGRISEKLLYRLSGGLFLAFSLVSLKQALA
ncbi:MAG: TMEM165/GDT1 family protein, partial [Synechococcaceae cyanobacterium]|nr:TMEM165/GDT1 family protein [Synechococcaceae cyanobacterium]